MAEMVRLIAERGPRIDEIARSIGVYNETVRYWYKNMLRRGFAIQASCNYERLGMKRVVVIAEFADIFAESADTVLTVMGQGAFVIGYAMTTPGKRHILSASVPQECLDSWTDFMLELKKVGVLKTMEGITLDWVRNVPMRAEYFDFGSGTWDSEWDEKSRVVPDVKPGPRQDYDAMDLKIIEQLQANANLSVVQMRERVGAKNYKTFAWHNREHVFGRGLIRGYRVNWTGADYDSKSAGPSSKKRGYSWLDLVAAGLSEEERLALRASMNRIPFVWMEGSGAGTYYARLAVPSSDVNAFLRVLERAVSPFRRKTKRFQLDQTHALSFALPNHLYDGRERRWTFKKDEVLQTFETLRTVRGSLH
jgi:DNA-binding Lrp family transcriptional regulator